MIENLYLIELDMAGL